LNLLRATLAKRPDATPLLAKLHDWLQAKKRGARCAKDGLCAASIKKKPVARTTQAQPAGRLR